MSKTARDTEPGPSDYAARAKYFGSIPPEQNPDAPAEAERCLRILVRYGGSVNERDRFSFDLASLIGREPSRRGEAFDLIMPVAERGNSSERVDACLMLAADPERRRLAVSTLRMLCADAGGPWSCVFAVAARVLAEEVETREEAHQHLKNVGWSMDTGAVAAIHAAAAGFLCDDHVCWMGFPRLDRLLDAGSGLMTIDAAVLCYIHRLHPYCLKSLGCLRRCVKSPSRPWYLSYSAHIEKAAKSHPSARYDWLPALAEVCRGDATPAILDQWSEWCASGVTA